MVLQLHLQSKDSVPFLVGSPGPIMLFQPWPCETGWEDFHTCSLIGGPISWHATKMLNGQKEVLKPSANFLHPRPSVCYTTIKEPSS